MKFFKLDSRGVAHHFLLALIVVGVAVGGTYYLISSYADTCDISGATSAVSGNGCTDASGVSDPFANTVSCTITNLPEKAAFGSVLKPSVEIKNNTDNRLYGNFKLISPVATKYFLSLEPGESRTWSLTSYEVKTYASSSTPSVTYEILSDGIDEKFDCSLSSALPVSTTPTPPKVVTYGVPKLSNVSFKKDVITYSWSTSSVSPTTGMVFEAKPVKTSVRNASTYILANDQKQLKGTTSLGNIPDNTTYQVRIGYMKDSNSKTRTYTSPVTISNPNDDLTSIGCKLNVANTVKNGQTLTARYTLTSKGPLAYVGKGNLKIYMDVTNAGNGGRNGDGSLRKAYKLDNPFKAGETMVIRQSIKPNGPKTGIYKPVNVKVVGYLDNPSYGSGMLKCGPATTVKVTN